MTESFGRYEPPVLPTDSIEVLSRAMEEELRRIADTFRDQSLGQYTLELRTSEPKRIFDGLVARADGINWNPGGGAGVYWYSEVQQRWIIMGSQDFYFDVASGKIPGHSVVNKFGRNPAVGTSISVVSSTGIYEVPTSAVSLEVLSSDNDDGAGTGLGALTVTIIGLDANWAEQTIDVTLNGTTPVAVPSTWLRVYRAYVTSAGTYGTLTNPTQQGTLTVRVSGGGTTFIIIDEITTGFGTGQSEVAAFTVPAGKTAFVNNFQAWVDSVQNTALFFMIRLNADDVVTPFTGALRIQQQALLVSSDSASRFTMAPQGPIPEKTDIGIIGFTNAGTSAITAGFQIVLVDN